MFWTGFAVGVLLTSVVAHALMYVIRLIDHVWRTHQYCDKCGAELRQHPR